MFQLTCFCLLISQASSAFQECNLLAGKWKIVREVLPSHNRMHPATDGLAGTDSYGIPGDPAWSTVYSHLVYDEFLFITGNLEQWLVSKSALFNTPFGSNSLQTIECSVYNLYQSYQARWYFRYQGYEDPWVSYRDHGFTYPGSSQFDTMLYGQSSNSGHTWTMINNDGLQVRIRDSAAQTQIIEDTDFSKTLYFYKNTGIQIDTFPKFVYSDTSFATCEMSQYILQQVGSNLQFPVGCTQPCNRVEFDTSISITRAFQVYAYGGPNSFVLSNIRSIEIVEKGIFSHQAFEKNQIVQAGTIDASYQINQFLNSKHQIAKYEILDLTCSQNTLIANSFNNSLSLISTLDNGILKAYLSDETTPFAYYFCLKVTEILGDYTTLDNLSIEVQEVVSPCLTTLSIKPISVGESSYFQVYNNTFDKVTLAYVTNFVQNENELNCTNQTYKIMNQGCTQDYIGTVLSIGAQNELQALTNSTQLIDLKFCVQVQSKYQSININNLNYVQQPPCSTFMKFRPPDQSNSIVSKGEKSLIVIQIIENQEYQISLLNYIKWDNSVNCKDVSQIKECGEIECLTAQIQNSKMKLFQNPSKLTNQHSSTYKIDKSVKYLKQTSYFALKISNTNDQKRFSVFVSVNKTNSQKIQSNVFENNLINKTQQVDEPDNETTLQIQKQESQYLNDYQAVERVPFNVLATKKALDINFSQQYSTSQNLNNQLENNNTQDQQNTSGSSEKTCVINFSSQLTTDQIKRACDYQQRLNNKMKKLNREYKLNKLKTKLSEGESPPPIQIKIKDFNHNGELTLILNQKIVRIFDYINGRRLYDDQILDEEKEFIAHLIFQFKFDSQLLDFSHVKSIQVKNWTETEIKLKFVFVDPLKVSQGGIKDFLEVEVRPSAYNLIVSQNTYEEMKEINYMKFDLPSQLPIWIPQVEANKQAILYRNGCISLMIVQIILQIFFKMNFNQLIMLIQQMQLINALRIYHFQCSALTEIIFEELQSLLYFELLSPNWYLNQYYPGLTMTNLFQSSIQRYQDDKEPLFTNFTLGMIFWFFLALLNGLIYFVIRSKLSQEIQIKVENIYKEQKKNLFFKRLITMFMIQYVQQIIICYTLIRERSVSKSLSIYLLSIAFSFFMGVFLKKNYELLNKPYFKSKYDMAYIEVSISGRERYSVLYFTSFYIKRGVLLMIPLIDNSGVEIICITLLIETGILVYGYIRAHETRLRRNNEFMNDFIFIMITYSMIGMTNFVEYESVIFNNGYQFLSQLTLMIVSNITIQGSLIKNKKKVQERIIKRLENMQEIFKKQALKRKFINQNISIKLKEARMRFRRSLLKPSVLLRPDDNEANSSKLSTINEYDEIDHIINEEEASYNKDVENRTFEEEVYSSINYTKTENNRMLQKGSIDRYQHVGDKKTMTDLKPINLQEKYISTIDDLTPPEVNYIENPRIFRYLKNIKITNEQHEQVKELNEEMRQIINIKAQNKQKPQKVSIIEKYTSGKRYLKLKECRDLTEDQRHQINQTLSILKVINGCPYKLPEKDEVFQQPKIDNKTFPSKDLKDLFEQNLINKKLLGHRSQMGQFETHDFEKDPNNKIIHEMEDGSIYRGQLNDEGLPQKLGIMIYLDRSIYEGFWENNQQNGQGILVKPDGETLLGEFKTDQANGLFTIKYPDGSRYDGDIICGSPHGDGLLKKPDGSFYIGKFWYGFKQGKGKEDVPEKFLYEGEFLTGFFHGYGKYTDLTNQIQYNGNFESGYRHGYGEVFGGDEPGYKGYFHIGMKHGQGQQTNKKNHWDNHFQVIREGQWYKDEFLD